ncbi:helix-turn-helix domain-containing protein [Paenibacillus doosanensis]|uniref:helix-turn-helix domain-containing protein n=1 Tax=Paenibacillus doosanensis TaxID=1229154 RepID=UPI00217FA67D|nr:helix-turn-helix domain-containing protein [Paenibacillus doosanensis]MCS7458794.1 helix-turn-helix domain-containing protein [Paenibacillus doosanensis]
MAENLNDPAADLTETAAPPPGILVSGHFRQAHGYQTHRSFGTKDWLITFTLSGTGHYWLDGRLQPCEPGDIVLLPPGTPHHYATPEGSVWEFVWAHFMPLPHWSEWLTLPSEAGALHVIRIAQQSVRERIREAFQRMIRDSLELDYYRSRLSLNAMEEILLLAQQAEARVKSGQMDPRVEQVLSHLSQHMKQRHSVEELAAKVALSPSRLAHLFKQEIGESVIDTLLRLRLRQASRLLEYTTMQIAEIADEVGFHNPFYFTKQFTAYYGKSPSQYRKEARKSAVDESH